MTVVRELITMLGFSVDQGSYQKAQRAYDQMQGRLSGGGSGAAAAAQQVQQTAKKTTDVLGQALGMAQRFGAQFGLSAMLKQYVTLASDANETSSAIGQLFGQENIAKVEAWSQAMGATMGRSQFDLQSYAARLGSVLGPVTKSREEAQAMAQSLSELAVDLGSFFNTTDQEAMQALRSGLTGEMESLKRYGVVINEATLAELAHKRGIKKKVSQMTVAEKTELRYAAIIESTKTAQGDAARTSDGFANSSKALEAGLKDIGIIMAKTVIPAAEKLVHWARDAVVAFDKAAKGTHVLEAAFWTLATVAGVLALEFYGAFVLPAIAIAALILVVDELWTTLDGGDSILRDWIDGMFGIGKTAELVASLKESFAGINAELATLDARGVWETFVAGVQNAEFAVERLVEKLIDLAGWLNPVEAATRLLRKAGVLGQGDATERATRGINGRVAESISEEIAWRQRDQAGVIQAGVTQRKAARAERKREETYGPREFSMAPGQQATWTPMGYGFLDAPAQPSAAGGGPATVNLAAPIININGGDTDKVRRVITETMEAERKKTIAAVGGRGRS